MYLTLLNGTGYVFDVDDYMELRIKHRIVGALVGTANSKGWSSSEAALPVELTKCETQLLIDEGLAILVSKAASLMKSPTPEILQEYQEDFAARLKAQADSLKAEKLRETERHVEKILSGKRNKLLKQGKSDEAAALTSQSVIQEVANNFEFDHQNALVELPCPHLAKHTAQLWTEPICDRDSLKYRVFRDLWGRGKFVTCGDAFGADFLIYPGDPMLYHASHIVIIQSTPAIRPLELISKVRLSVIVNKSCVFAYEAADGKTIVYQTVAWCNPSK
ncbi:PREDICTED: tRNA-splicing endonuclease subunit Sen34 [Drosophila arizonae]|uniref:tRNA-splicing endonuclease subunit Sen34 n=1 Tax=Drosophila arizonae TaxID=7263 RepID=A0ABM1P5S4_DROAR|nr:PREDICTED: tRNA-splicing endonuclease subunit Sen34 [Drosophila arizonae]XP_017862560.1 PREDICTED: tRNA-splicing endonuclease subunit Sen34 [Drosophila arizonae]